jgi:hypothetical protein
MLWTFFPRTAAITFTFWLSLSWLLALVLPPGPKHVPDWDTAQGIRTFATITLLWGTALALGAAFLAWLTHRLLDSCHFSVAILVFLVGWLVGEGLIGRQQFLQAGQPAWIGGALAVIASLVGIVGATIYDERRDMRTWAG